MLVIKIWAGLANQMFQYALYKSLIASGKTAFIDIPTRISKWDFEKINFMHVFPNASAKTVSPELANLINSRYNNNLYKIRNKIYTYLNIPNGFDLFYIKEPKYSYNPFIKDLEGDYYLEGFWQTEKYFREIADSIRKDFTFRDFTDARNLELEKIIRNSSSVSIHVRKGKDYKKRITKGTCNIDYYKKAIEVINKKVDNPKFFIFSDNIEWCKDNLSFCSPTYVDWNPGSGKGNHLDMQLMTGCKYNIVANSSYSWWGAWLNSNPEKIVVAPQIWFNEKYSSFDTSDIIPEDWIKL